MSSCFPKWVYHFNNYQNLSYSHSVTRFGIIFHSTHSNRHVVVYHCGFNLLFPNN